MLTKLRKRNEGFTIVETLIVLAIAGLIILIVLLAVPALQRTSRNTNIKSDASAIAGGFSEYESNNAGSLPTGVSAPTAAGVVNLTGGAGTTQATAKVQGSDTIPTPTTTGTVAAPGTVAQGALIIHEKQSCNSVVLNNRAISIYYDIESTGASGVGCVDD